MPIMYHAIYHASCFVLCSPLVRVSRIAQQPLAVLLYFQVGFGALQIDDILLRHCQCSIFVISSSVPCPQPCASGRGRNRSFVPCLNPGSKGRKFLGGWLGCSDGQTSQCYYVRMPVIWANVPGPPWTKWLKYYSSSSSRQWFKQNTMPTYALQKNAWPGESASEMIDELGGHPSLQSLQSRISTIM